MRAKQLTWADICAYAEAQGTAISGISIRMLLNSNDPLTHRFSHELHSRETEKLYANVRDWIARGRPQDQPMFSLDLETLREGARLFVAAVKREALKE